MLSKLPPELSAGTPLPAAAPTRGDTRQAGVGVGAQGPPWARPTVADALQDKAPGSLPRPGDGKEPHYNLVGASCPRLRFRRQAARSPGSNAGVGHSLLALSRAEQQFCQPTRVKSAALFFEARALVLRSLKVIPLCPFL